LTLYAGAFFCVGFMEEVSFRGYVFHNLNAWLGVRISIAIQAIVFSAIHLSNLLQKENDGFSAVLWDAKWGLLNIALIGIFFAQCYLKTGSLWFPIGFHAAWNFFLGCVFSLPVSGIKIFRLLDVSMSSNTTLNGGNFGAEGSVLLIPIIGALIYMLSRLPNHLQAELDLSSLVPPYSSLPAQTGVQPAGVAPTAPDETLAPDDDSTEEEDGPRERRFSTSMRGSSAIDTELLAALQNNPPSTTEPGIASQGKADGTERDIEVTAEPVAAPENTRPDPIPLQSPPVGIDAAQKVQPNIAEPVVVSPAYEPVVPQPRTVAPPVTQSSPAPEIVPQTPPTREEAPPATPSPRPEAKNAIPAQRPAKPKAPRW
ncbi:MAG TPA: CPBP family glutamic-type intramembrane protease, partial [Abditibacteriaceae bacterium]